MVVPIMVTLKVKAAPRKISSGNKRCCLGEGMHESRSAIFKSWLPYQKGRASRSMMLAGELVNYKSVPRVGGQF